MNGWAGLVQAALIGSERRPAAGTDGPLDPGVDVTPEQRLLAQAAALTLAGLAGQLPGRDERPLPLACPPDERPALGARATQLLRTLQAAHPPLLEEWLTLAARSGRRAPDILLPWLLGLGRSQRALRPLILPLLGRRGAWLAALNPPWAWAAGADAGNEEALWLTASREVRLSVLREVRERDPARALTWLEGSWASEPPEERAAFLDVLAAGLSGADEPFLEAALDDRRREVRAQAARLLACLPDSRLVARHVARLTPRLKAQGAALHVELPAACDASMQRDGVSLKPPAGSGVGERAWWLQQLLASVPPGVWERRWGLPPERIVRLAATHEWSRPLLDGLSEAALRCADHGWARALLPLVPRHLPALLGVLPPREREAWVLELLRSDGTPGLVNAAPALQACLPPWSDALTRALLARLHALLGRSAPDWNTRWAWQALLAHAATCAPPHLADEVHAGWPRGAPGWPSLEEAAEKFGATLDFRRQLHEEMTRQEMP